MRITDANAHCNSHSDAYCHRNRDGDIYFHAQSNANAAGSANAEDTANPAAATITFFERSVGLIASNRQYVLISEKSRATHQRDVRKSLREIAQLTLVAWIVFFREQSKIVAEIKQPLE